MSNLSADVDNLKRKYREIFLKTSNGFNRRIRNMTQSELCKFLTEGVLKEIYELQMKILESRLKFNCFGCAVCCKLACSQFSPGELKQKSNNGDNFANQFLNVFVPYEDEQEARKIYPEYFELLKTQGINENNVDGNGEKVYFYHCPKVTSNNLCPDYENRPDICKDFPDNPIGFLPKSCGYTNWKQEVEPIALELRSLLEIVDFYKEKMHLN